MANLPYPELGNEPLLKSFYLILANVPSSCLLKKNTMPHKIPKIKTVLKFLLNKVVPGQGNLIGSCLTPPEQVSPATFLYPEDT